MQYARLRQCEQLSKNEMNARIARLRITTDSKCASTHYTIIRGILVTKTFKEGRAGYSFKLEIPVNDDVVNK